MCLANNWTPTLQPKKSQERAAKSHWVARKRRTPGGATETPTPKLPLAPKLFHGSVALTQLG